MLGFRWFATTPYKILHRPAGEKTKPVLRNPQTRLFRNSNGLIESNPLPIHTPANHLPNFNHKDVHKPSKICPQLQFSHHISHKTSEEYSLHLLLHSRPPSKLKLLCTPRHWMRLNHAKSKPHVTHKIQIEFFARDFDYTLSPAARSTSYTTWQMYHVL